ncbi:CHAD domain-containing protein, partial [Candidatus Binatia bacterium]|nr:CHAD domain-containing protein [Candidatus Binatia bacterium]
MRQERAGASGAPQPAPSLRLRAAQVIDEQRAKMFAQVASAVDGRDPEGVHDMRVATRRLRAALNVFAPWLEPDELARLAPAVRSLTRALGRVRELDVLRLRLSGLAAQATPQRALAIESIDARLARRRSRQRAGMMAVFAKVDLDRLDGRLQRLVAQLARHVDPAIAPADAKASAPSIDAVAAAHMPTPASVAHPVDLPIAALLEALAPAVLEEARDVALAEPPVEIGTPRSAEALHRVRIAAKKLRYTLEIVAPYLGDGGSAAVKRLRGVQEHLGDFHDDCVLDDTLRPAYERAQERGRPLLAAELRALRATRRRALLRD